MASRLLASHQWAVRWYVNNQDVRLYKHVITLLIQTATGETKSTERKKKQEFGELNCKGVLKISFL